MSTSKKRPDLIWHEYWQHTPDDSYLAAEASVVANNLIERFELTDQDVILDFGCGYGYVSEQLARTVSAVDICDEVDSAVERAMARIGASNVSPVDPAETDRRYNLIVVNSVVQYMGERTLSGWLQRWAELLAPGGKIAISDVPSASPSLVVEGFQWFSYRQDEACRLVARQSPYSLGVAVERLSRQKQVGARMIPGTSADSIPLPASNTWFAMPQPGTIVNSATSDDPCSLGIRAFSKPKA